MVYMASATAPRTRANELFPEDSLLALGERKAQEHGDGCYVPFPQPHARNFGVEQSSTVDIHIDSRTGALVVLPPDVSLDDVLEA